MDQQAWIALDCTACGGRLRAPRSAVGTSVGCPNCHAPVKVQLSGHFATPMIVDSRINLGVNPSAASTAETEQFKSRLRNLSDDQYKVDPDNPVMKRRDNRKAKHGAALTNWDNTGRSSSRSGSHDSRKQQKRLVIVLGIVTCLLVAVLAGILVSGKGSLVPPAPLPSTASAAPRAGASSPDALLELRPASDYRDAVWKVVTQFCRTENPRDLRTVIRDPERVAPLIREYYGSEGRTWLPIPVGDPIDPSKFSTDKNWVAFELPLPDFQFRSMAVQKTPQGYKVDWESFVAYSELSWKDLREKRPRTPTLMRVILRPVGYFNNDFPSEDTHRCFQLRDEHRENVIYGYVKRGSDTERRMQEMMINAREMNAIVRVAYPEKSTTANQVEIAEVVDKGWVLGKDAPSPSSSAPPTTSTVSTDGNSPLPVLPPS
ncbi:MAG: hypothetical protein EOP86_05765, partial [Verrucomicrobiaceae bacterium]